MARLVSCGVGAVEPGMLGFGPDSGGPPSARTRRLEISDIQRIEINEAFAAIAIAVARELGLGEDIVNVEGAIAHGHPIGATGAVLTTRLLHSMKRDSVSSTMVPACAEAGRPCHLSIWRCCL